MELLAPSPARVRQSAPPAWTPIGDRVELDAAAATDLARRLLAPEAARLLAALHDALEPERQALIAERLRCARRYDAGYTPGFLPEGAHPDAHGDWRVAPLPADLRRRRVEITGPVHSAKMVINMLSRTEGGHRADAAMLDFEDSLKPSWTNVMNGMANVIGVADGTLTHVQPGTDGAPEKVYRLDPADMPVVMVRVRGLHLSESNVRVDGAPVSAGLFDFALVAFHTARAYVEQGKTPAFYVPKCESYLEARWWNRLFVLVQEALGLPVGTIRATFLIETLPAAFQMEEILYEIRAHAAGLNGGRWDKIFSDIKVLKEHEDRILADRASIGMNRPWMRDYARLLIKTCHRHGAFGMGGMAAFTPGKTAERRAEQTAKVAADKAFEASIGHDGCWVSHPYFIGPALAAFPRENQLDVLPDVADRPDLLPLATGPKTLGGLRTNVRVGIAYLQGWNDGLGCVAWDDLMEDLATLEISRAQTWQWLHHGVKLDGGEHVTLALVRRVFAEEHARIEADLHADGASDALVQSFAKARVQSEAVFTERTFRPFLTCVSEPESDRLAGRGSLHDAHC